MSVGEFERPVLGVRFNPRLFRRREEQAETEEGEGEEGEDEGEHQIDLEGERSIKQDRGKNQNLFKLPYRMIYAIFTTDSLIIFDTQQGMPIALCKDLHYGSLTDAAWTSDGLGVLVASTDGFCSAVQFDPLELGEPLGVEEQAELLKTLQATISPPRPKSIIPSSMAPCMIISEDAQQIASSEPEDPSLIPPSAPPTSDPMQPAKRRIQPTLISPVFAQNSCIFDDKHL